MRSLFFHNLRWSGRGPGVHNSLVMYLPNMHEVLVPSPDWRNSRMTHGHDVILKIRCTQTRIRDVNIPNELLTADSSVIILTSIIHIFPSDLLHLCTYKCLPACMYACHLHAWSPPLEAGSFGTGATDVWEPPCGGWETNPGCLQEQHTSLTTEPSLQLPYKTFINC